MLWSTTLTAGKPENVEAIFSLNITQATLGKANGERHFVKVTYLNPVTEENVTAVVAVLQTGQNENVALNLVFDQGETFTLSSTAQIFLTGYYVTDMDEDDDDEDRFALPDDFDEDEDDEDLDDEDLEEDESEEEEPKIKEIPVAAPPAKKQAVGQGAAPKAVPVKAEAAKPVAAAKAAPAPAAKAAAPAPAAAKAAAPAAAAPAAGEGNKKKKNKKKKQEGEEAGLPSDILNSIAAKAPAAAAPAKAAAAAAPAKAAAPAAATPAKAAAPAAATPAKAAAAPAASPAKPAAPKTTTLPSGLVIQDVNVGKGDKADRGKKVFVNYIGKLESGRVFDKSARPFKFRLGVGEVIKGWDQGVVGMQVGGTRNLVIPASLAYGKAGAPPDIPPNATLHFSVELVRVERS